MSRQRKYTPGEPITDMGQLATEIAARRYVYWRDKPMHPSWLGSMRFNVLAGFIRRGFLRIALPTGEAAP